jgi:glucose-6-phosphate dehydrogenase assembly protein OpcA
MSAVIFPAQPEQILKGLSRVWTSLGEEEKTQGKPTVLRACAMTLIVATDEADNGYHASQTISDLMKEHPSRGIVLAVSEEADKAVQARVLAQCWKPFGKAQQICCEQIEITSRPESWPNIGPTLAGLIVPDLPVVFWCRHKAALSPSATRDQKAGLEAVMSFATKVVVDTRYEDPASAIALLAGWRARGQNVSDLEWTRLTRWREPLAHIFDNPTRENTFSNFREIEIAHTDDQPPPSALYAGGWVSAPYRAQVSFVKAKGFGSGLHSITLRADDETIRFERTSPQCMRLHSSKGPERTYNFVEPDDAALMTEELAVLGSDPAFNAAFNRVQELLPDSGDNAPEWL